MNDQMIIEDLVAYLPGSAAAVTFTPSNLTIKNGFVQTKGTAAPIKKLVTALDIVPWGEDNRFPQNIVNLMVYYGVGQAALKWKAHELYGAGIIPGKVIDYTDGGATEVFKPLDRTKYKPVYQFLEAKEFARFYLEFLQDWTWFSNCWPEMIFSNDCKTIEAMVHQESCDCRYKQMSDGGQIDTVYISKLWGMAQDQYVKFDPKQRIMGIIENPKNIASIDPKFIKQISCADPYDTLNSLKSIAETEAKKADGELKSCLLPVYYPSPNKTYYQLASWDAARLSGWVEIAIKIPSLVKSLYSNSFNIKYLIQMPESVLWDAAGGKDKWQALTNDPKGKEKKKAIKKQVLKDMDTFLKGDENAGKSWINFFGYDPVNKAEVGKITIEQQENKNSIDKDLLTSASANSEFLAAAGINPDTLGMGIPGGAYGGNKGGSNIRESKIIYDANLFIERQVICEPLYAVRDFNREVGSMSEWEEDIVFRIRDVQLTTLNQNTGSQKIVG